VVAGSFSIWRMVRRMKFIIIAAILLLNILPINAQQQVDIPWPTLMDSPWPMTKHDPQGTGRSSFTGPKTPNVFWTRDMEYGVLSGPVLDHDNNLYFGTNTYLGFSDTSNYFYSVSSKGELNWEFRTFEAYANTSGLLISADSTIYFNATKYKMYALDVNKNLRWIHQSDSFIYQDLMNIDLQGNVYFVTNDGNLNSIDGTGNINWIKSYDSGFWTASPVLSPDGLSIYISGKDSNLYALDLDGTLQWKFSCGKASAVPMVNNSGNIYVISTLDSTGLHSIYPNGTLRWSYNFTKWDFVNGPLWLSPTMDSNGNIYFPAPVYQQSKMVSVDYNGHFRWEYFFEHQDEEIWVPLICDADGTVYFGSTWGYYYYAISSVGELLWKLPLDGYQVDNSGAIGSDGTFVYRYASRITCYRTGKDFNCHKRFRSNFR
jgi:PQQ-like domain